MMFSREFLDELKRTVDLKDLAEEYTELRKAGPTLYVGHCPHPKHNDSDASEKWIVMPLARYCGGD